MVSRTIHEDMSETVGGAGPRRFVDRLWFFRGILLRHTFARICRAHLAALLDFGKRLVLVLPG